MHDGCRRDITYLRVSITDRCNLRCFYCRPVQEMVRLSHDDILRYEEFERLIRLAVGLGIKKVRVTGGEPLVRKGVEEFIATLHGIPGLEEVCLTTNGVLLAEKAAALYAAGLRRLNISLDSLKPERYREITGVGEYPRVWAGIEAALRQGFAPVKLNCVLLKGINDDEIVDFARLSRTQPLHIRFIEFMPVGGGSRWRPEHYLPGEVLLERLESLGPLEELPTSPAAGPARRFRYAGAAGEMGLISPISQHFCATCNRLRLTADGRLRPCLLCGGEIDIKGPLRQGVSESILIERFRAALAAKPAHHPLLPEDLRHGRAMTSIGG